MEKEGAKPVEIKGLDDKRQITVVFGGMLIGEFLPMQLVYQGRTTQCHPNSKFPDDWHITHSDNHWSNETTMINYIAKIIIPFVRKKHRELKKTEDQVALAIFDEFKGQVTQACCEMLWENKHTFYSCSCQLHGSTSAVGRQFKQSSHKATVSGMVL